MVWIEESVHVPKRNARIIIKMSDRTVKRVRSLAGSPVVMGIFSLSRAVIVKAPTEAGEAFAVEANSTPPSHGKSFIPARCPYSEVNIAKMDGVEKSRDCLAAAAGPQGTRRTGLIQRSTWDDMGGAVGRLDKACAPSPPLRRPLTHCQS
jgi:hypothetical protein